MGGPAGVVRPERLPGGRCARPAGRGHPGVGAAARAIVDDVRAPRRRPGDGGLQHPRALRPHLRQRRVPRGLRRRAHPRARRGRGRAPSRRASGSRSGSPTTRTTRTATRSSRPRSCSPTTRSRRSRVLDLGDRQVELVHPGRGHSVGDAVVRVGDADVLLAGDLVEESAPPAYGVDCHPFDWPGSLDVVLDLLGADTVVVPGTARSVDRDFVEEQRDAIAIVAQTIRDLAASGVPADRALAEGEWPFPREGLTHAVALGYAALPPAAREPAARLRPRIHTLAGVTPRPLHDVETPREPGTEGDPGRAVRRGRPAERSATTSSPTNSSRATTTRSPSRLVTTCPTTCSRRKPGTPARRRLGGRLGSGDDDASGTSSYDDVLRVRPGRGRRVRLTRRASTRLPRSPSSVAR